MKGKDIDPEKKTLKNDYKNSIKNKYLKKYLILNK